MRMPQKKEYQKGLTAKENKFQVLAGGRILEKDQIKKCAENLMKMSRRIEGWNGSDEIRKLRDSL